MNERHANDNGIKMLHLSQEQDQADGFGPWDLQMRIGDGWLWFAAVLVLVRACMWIWPHLYLWWVSRG
jgi:hypothetical protein